MSPDSLGVATTVAIELRNHPRYPHLVNLTPDEARLVCMALRQYAAEYATVQDAETLEAVAARIEGEDRP